MKLLGFHQFVKAAKLMQPYVLKDCTVVVDGTSLAYHRFQHRDNNIRFQQRGQHTHGCECDEIAERIKKYLSMFEKAKCIFIFKGGDDNYMEKIKNNKFCNEYTVLFYDTFRQSLEELGIEYTICEFSVKQECIAVARKLNCPLIGFNVEYVFSNTLYIPFYSLTKPKDSENFIGCELFEMNRLYNKYPNVTKEKLALLIVLRDISIFPEDTFVSFFKNLSIYGFKNLFKWLSEITFDEAIDEIFKLEYKNVVKKTFIEEIQKSIKFLDRAIQGGIPVQYLLNGNDAPFKSWDVDWFKKGIASKHIAVPYVDMYHHKIIRAFSSNKREIVDSKLFSIDIIKYTYDLLTNFQQESLEGFTLIKYFGELIKPTAKEEKILSEVKSIRKPMYDAVTSVFENGWNGIKKLELFEHFLKETVQFDFQRLESVPEDVKMLFISLVYFSRKNVGNCARNIVHCVLLSYVMLNMGNENDENFKSLKKFFSTNTTFVQMNVQYTLNQYVICLENLNYLNTLCGAPYETTVYRKVFNATLIYNMCRTIMSHYGGKVLRFIEKDIKPCNSAFSHYESLQSMFNNLEL